MNKKTKILLITCGVICLFKAGYGIISSAYNLDIFVLDIAVVILTIVIFLLIIALFLIEGITRKK